MLKIYKERMNLLLQILIFIATGLFAGMLGSVAGLGGGMIILPILEIAMGFDVPTAIGTSLFAIIFTSLSSLWGHARAGNVDWRMGLWVGCSGILGVVLGSWFFKIYLVNHTRELVFFLGLWFWFLTFRMARQVYQAKKAQRENKIPPMPENHPHYGRLPLCTLGLVTGILAGVLGIGGGAIMTSVMVGLWGLSPAVSVGTSFVAMFPLSLCGGLMKLAQGFVNLKAGILLGSGTAIGAQLGIFLLRVLSPVTVKMIFVVLFGLLGCKYVFFG